MQSLQEKDKKYIWHPFTSFKHPVTPIPIVKGEGLYLQDEAGNRYMDMISSWWVNLHGHAHPYIAEKIYQQALLLEQVIFAGFTHRPAIELAERLLPLLPGDFSKIFYSDNGSTSTEVAIKMALQYWWNNAPSPVTSSTSPALRKKVLAFNNAYHGDTFGAMSVSDRSIFTLAFQEKLFEVIFIDAPATGISNQLDNLPWQEIACFIYEPLLQGAGGMKLYDAESLDAILKQCKQQNVICIADEVMTGFGRTGKLFASEYVEEKPDIICLSKGLTGGTMALGVTATTQKIVDAFVSDDKLKTFFHGHSFTANPLACTAALASLDLLLAPECLASIGAITAQNKHFVQQLKNCEAAHKIKNPRSLGTVVAFEWNEGSDEYLNNISQRITTFMLAKGIYLRPLGNTVYIMPPYCSTKQELQCVYETILLLIATQ